MRSFFLCLILAFSFIANKAFAADVQELKIDQKIFYHNNLFVVADDKTIWELFIFDLRLQTWSEWWNNVKVTINDEYRFDEKCWMVGDVIKLDDNEIGDAIAANLKEEDRLKYHNFAYVIKNVNSNKKAFARPLSIGAMAEKILIFANNEYQKGYDSGYNKGYNKGSDEGYSSGYSIGYSTGHNFGYDSGYNCGYTKGYNEGRYHQY